MFEYDACGRMKYNQELHFNQGQRWSEDELDYLINWFDKIGSEEMSLALGRTEATIGEKVSKLRKEGLMDRRCKARHPRLLRRNLDEQTFIA